MIRVNNMSGIKGMVGRKMTKAVTFMEEKVNISKLSVAQVLAIQESAKEVEADDDKSFALLKNIIMSSVEGGDELAEDDFKNFPLDELSKLSNEIMKFSGIAGDAKGK
jgi:hypothetical protein